VRGRARGAAVAAAAIAAIATACGASATAAISDTVGELHFAMATTVWIAARGDSESATRAAVRSAFAEVRRLEDIVSTFDAASDASRVNRSAGGDAVAVAAELADLLATSQRLTRATDGAFSILVGPLLDVWRAAEEAGGAPEESALAHARTLADPDLLAISGARVALLRPGMRIDLGGVAKGFAADRALAVLRAAGVRAAIVNLGGSSIAAFGDAGDRLRGWPVELPGASLAVFRLRDAALSTSSARGRSLAGEGSRPGHIVDPTTGRLLERAAVAVVLHRSATDAEALSKALLLRASEAGPILAAAGADGVLLRPDEIPACSEAFRSALADCTVLPPAGAAARS